jgi:hypothetical protein
LSLGVMVWVNAVRYDFGLNGYDLPASFAQPGLSHIRLGISVVIGLLLVMVSGYLLVRAWRTKPDFRPGSEPEIQPTLTGINAG